MRMKNLHAEKMRPKLEMLEDRITPTSMTHVAYGTDAGVEAKVRVYDQSNGTQTAEITPFPGFTGGARVAVGNVDSGNAGDEVVVAAGSGGGPHVKVYTVDGTLLAQGFVYGIGFTGGVYVTVGNVDPDAEDEIIVGAGEGGGPHVRAFDVIGSDLVLDTNGIGEFLAFDPAVTLGVRVGSGESLAGSAGANDEVVVGVGPGAAPHVKIFDGDDGSELNSFFAYNPAFTGGVYVSIANADGNAPGVVVGPGETGGPHVKFFDDGFGNGGMPDLEDEFFALNGNTTFTGGIRPGTTVLIDEAFAGDADFQLGTGPGLGGLIQFTDSDNEQNDLDMFLFDPFPTVPLNTGVFVS